MSRIGKHPVAIPSGVTVTLNGQHLTAKGKLGQLELVIADEIEAKVEGGKVTILPRGEDRRARMMWGTHRTRVANLVKGVAEGFREGLEINGVGFRAAIQGKELVLNIGFSHEVRYPIPEGITIKADKPTALSITGADKQKVGQVAAEIRAMKKPEPYKGKGIKYESETIRRKEGKKK